MSTVSPELKVEMEEFLHKEWDRYITKHGIGLTTYSENARLLHAWRAGAQAMLSAMKLGGEKLAE